MDTNGYKLDENGKLMTCAVVIINKNGDILGCHGTGKPNGEGYDFPKGCSDLGESDLQTALRELYEETGIIMSNEELIDCGIHNHNKEKNIHIFLCKTDTMPMIEKLKCSSYFNFNGKQFPEIDYYEIIPKNKRDKFNKVLQDKFKIIDSFNK
jgi:8-oxo-dGTP pyrophosphatase MutT (NUDIX family)